MYKFLLLSIFAFCFLINLSWAVKNCDKEDQDDKDDSDDEKKGLNSDKRGVPARIKEVTVTSSGPRPRRIYVHAQKPRVILPATGSAPEKEKKREPKKVAGGRVFPRDQTLKRRRIRVTKHRVHHSKSNHNKKVPKKNNRPRDDQGNEGGIRFGTEFADETISRANRDVTHAVNGPFGPHGHGAHGGSYNP